MRCPSIPKVALCVLCFFLLCGISQIAEADDLTIADITFSKNKVNPIKAKKKRWLEYRGSLNKQPVYLMLEKTKYDLLAGYLFDGKGDSRYVYGELVKNRLQLYDTKKASFSVLLFDE